MSPPFSFHAGNMLEQQGCEIRDQQVDCKTKFTRKIETLSEMDDSGLRAPLGLQKFAQPGKRTLVSTVGGCYDITTPAALVQVTEQLANS